MVGRTGKRGGGLISWYGYFLRNGYSRSFFVDCIIFVVFVFLYYCWCSLLGFVKMFVVKVKEVDKLLSVLWLRLLEYLVIIYLGICLII